MVQLTEQVRILTMAHVEAEVLRKKVADLEWALDILREDADRVRDDALAMVAEAQQHFLILQQHRDCGAAMDMDMGMGGGDGVGVGEY